MPSSKYKEATHRYNVSPLAKDAQARYRKTVKYKESRAKSAEKRAAVVKDKKEKKLEEVKAKTTATCTKCKVEQPLAEFNQSSEKLSKRTSWCKKCLKFRNISSYGLTEADFDTLLVEQNNRCAICENILQEGKYTHIDHDHSSNKVRGLLCNMCNIGIGMFNDDFNLLIKASQYLITRG